MSTWQINHQQCSQFSVKLHTLLVFHKHTVESLTLFGCTIVTTISLLADSSITTTMNIYFLLGGMTIFVAAILYSVISRIFYIPETLPRRRRSSRRPRIRWYTVWFNAAVAQTFNCFLYIRETTRAAFATLHAWITKSFRTPNDLQDNRRPPVNTTRCQNCEAQPLSASRTSARSLGSTRASQRTRGSRAPPSSPMSSSESSRSRSTRPLHPSRLSICEQASPTAPTSSSRNSSRTRTIFLTSTGVSPRATRSQSPPPSPVSSSGESTLVGTPSRAPSIVRENNSTQTTQRRGRQTRRCEIKAFIASMLSPSFEGDVSFISYNV